MVECFRCISIVMHEEGTATDTNSVCTVGPSIKIF